MGKYGAADRPQTTTKYGALVFAYLLPEVTNTHSEHVCKTYCSSTATMVKRPCLIAMFVSTLPVL